MFMGRYSVIFLTSFIFVESKPFMSVSQDLSIIVSCNSTFPVDKTSLNRALIEKRFDGSVEEKFKCFLHCLYHGYGWMDSFGLFQYDEMRITLMESNLDESSIEYLITTCTETAVSLFAEPGFYVSQVHGYRNLSSQDHLNNGNIIKLFCYEVEDKCERAFIFTECFWSEGEKLEQRDLSEMEEFC